MKMMIERIVVFSFGAVVRKLKPDEDREARRLAMDCPLLAGATYRCRRENHADILK
jgi:hypothetical protein